MGCCIPKLIVHPSATADGENVSFYLMKPRPLGGNAQAWSETIGFARNVHVLVLVLDKTFPIPLREVSE